MGQDDTLNKLWDQLTSSKDEGLEWSSRFLNRASEFLNAAQDRAVDFIPDTDLLSNFGSEDTARPVPTVRQHARCKEKGGQGKWDERGWWHCLLPGQTEFTGKNMFGDYTAYLEFKNRMREAALREAEEQARKSAVTPTISWYGDEKPRLISEEEAKGKQLVSSQIISETVTENDGTLATRRKTIRRYSDNTATLSESTERREPGKDDFPGGWFWK